ncbi:GNVR domain-containing protein [Janthinobacterium sp. TB1-E2]|nr:GNVR domain-containing protein [Janthinobacterium lividum]
MSEEMKNKEQHSSVSNNGMDFLDILTMLARQKKILFMMPLVVGSFAIAVAFLTKPTFSSTAVILPPQQQSSGIAAMLGQLGGLAGAAGSISGLKNPNDLYVAMLNSRTIADNLISHFDLRKRFSVKTSDDARKKLDELVSVSSEKSGIISVQVVDRDPKFAAELANAFVGELSSLTKNLAVTDAGQRRIFFEKQLIAAKDSLADAEVGLRNTQEKTGMLQLDGQVQGIIGNVAQLEGTIAAKEVQLNAMRSFATNNNPDLQRLQGEIQGYKTQLEKLKFGKVNSDGDLMVPTGNIPKIGVEYVRSLRNVKYQEAMFELLSKQYELAKIEEAKDSSVIQILDVAVPAEKEVKPKKLMIILLGFIFGGFLGLAFAYVRGAYLCSMRNDNNKYRWDIFKNSWKRQDV